MKKVTIIFGVDDFNPGVISENSEEINLLKSLFKNFPRLKVTAFCTPIYSYSNSIIKKHLYMVFGKTIKEKINLQNALSNNRFWLSKIQKMKENIKLEMHGYTHFNKNTHTGEEFKDLGKKETVERIEKGLMEFKKLKIKISVFAPPGWSINKYIKPCLKENKLCIADSFYNMKTKSFAGEKTNYLKPVASDGIVIIPRNIDINSGDKEMLKEIIKKNGIIAFHGHAKNIGVKNGITKENINNLMEMLKWLEKNFSVRYNFFHELKKGAK